jgi:hypothetical protein
MANGSTTSAKNVTGDSATFSGFMRRLMQVPHSEIKDKLDAERKAKQKPKRASRVVGAPSKAH